MAEHDPLRALDPIVKPCSARSKQTGKQCRKPAIPGGTVCRFHGGAAPQVKNKARERLAMLVSPAIEKLGKLIEQDDNPSVALGAARDVLDRNSITGNTAPAVQVNVLTKVNRVIVKPGTGHTDR